MMEILVGVLCILGLFILISLIVIGFIVYDINYKLIHYIDLRLGDIYEI